MAIQSLLRRATVKYLNHWLIWFLDTIVSTLSTIVVLVLFYLLIESPIPTKTLLFMVGTSFIISGISFYLFRTPRHIIRHSTLKNLASIGLATIAKAISIFIILHLISFAKLPYILIFAFADLLFTIVTLTGMRVVMIIVYDTLLSNPDKGKKKILIYGTDAKSVALAKRLKTGNSYSVLGFYAYGREYHAYKHVPIMEENPCEAISANVLGTKNIADLAINMIKLSGLTPHEDIEIIYTGLRKGEKLYEELLCDGESTISTPHKKIKIAKVREFQYDLVSEVIERYREVVAHDQKELVLPMIKELVPEYIESK